jgi:AAA+ superfamily predicted ATPase
VKPLRQVHNIQSQEGYQRIQDHLQLELSRLDLWLKYGQDGDGSIIAEQLKQNEQQLLDSNSKFESPLSRLYRICNLNRELSDLLLCCVAPSLDSRFDALLAALSDNGAADVTPTLLEKIFGNSPEWSWFCFESNPLFEMDLLYEDSHPGHLHSQLHRPIRASRRLIAYIRGDQTVAEETRDFLRVESPTSDLSGEMSSRIRVALDRLEAHVTGPEESLLLFFHGADGTGKLNAARQLCSRTNSRLLSFDFRQLPLDPERLSRTLKPILREIKVSGATVVIPDWHALGAGDRPLADPEFVLNRIREAAPLLILTSEQPFRLPRKKFPIVELAFDELGYADRAKSWGTHLNGSLHGEPTIDVQSLSGLYRFNEGQIKSVVQRSKLRRKALQGDENISESELIDGCREESSQKLAELAVRVATRHLWDFLILPEEQKDQLRELCNHMKFKARVYEDWAYNTRVAAAGLNVLFTGPPGTGKTLAASVIAKELGLDIYKIDLSTIVSKYIGETEKNLSKIFTEAESSNAILFFDEADSLFGKRSDVNDSHDRYANIQVGYLLQKMEEFPGMTILATNLVQNIDEAFTRRLHFSIDFPFPGAEERQRIWRVSFPEQAPLDANIDFESLGRKIKVPGGNIRNIALHAAFHAAADDGLITLDHIERAAKREYEKEGRSLNS